jgi:hypothetical protein
MVRVSQSLPSVDLIVNWRVPASMPADAGPSLLPIVGSAALFFAVLFVYDRTSHARSEPRELCPAGSRHSESAAAIRSRATIGLAAGGLRPASPAIRRAFLRMTTLPQVEAG